MKNARFNKYFPLGGKYLIEIMPKGQFPKIKGIVFNISIETEEVCNV